MADNPFYTFIDFISQHNTLSQVQKSRQRIAQQISDLDTELAEYRDARDTAHEKLNELHKQQHKKELASSQLAQDVYDHRRRLERVTQPKEYMSLQSEITRLQEQSEQLDEEVMELWSHVEQASQRYQHAQQQYQEAYDRITQEQEQLRQQDAEYAQQEQEVADKLNTLRDQVREEWLEAFDRKRKQVADPAVPVEHGVCTACFSTIPRNELRKLERHVILSCPNCYRLLYIV